MMKKINPYKVAFLVFIFGVIQTILTYILTPPETGGFINLPSPKRAFTVLIWTVILTLAIIIVQFLRGIWNKGNVESRVNVYLVVTAFISFFLYHWNLFLSSS